MFHLMNAQLLFLYVKGIARRREPISRPQILQSFPIMGNIHTPIRQVELYE